MILAGDIGGTSVRLACFERRDGRLVATAEAVRHSRDFINLESAVLQFREQFHVKLDCACFGVPGAVTNGRVQASNLPWIIEAAALERELGIPVLLINDLLAYASGLAELTAGQMSVLAPGADNLRGNAAVIAAGTGLGEAGLYWDGAKYRPFPAEGGHADFAPVNEVQDELLRYCRAKFGRVSCERVLSGPGLVNIYDFLRDTGRATPEPSLLQEMRQGDVAASISRHGVAGDSPICEQAVDIFVEIYGASAGNLALKYLSVGGMYIGGGIAPKILPKMRDPRFIRAFLEKGRMRALLEKVPVRVVLNEKTGLLGAAGVAAEKCMPAFKETA